MDREPIVTVATITGIVSAVIALLVAFGVSFNEQQTTAIMGIVGVLAPFVVAFIARQWTTPVAKAEAQAQDAYKEGLRDATPPTRA